MSEKELKLREIINSIMDELADYVDRLDDERCAKIYHEAKGDLDWYIFKLANEMSQNKKKIES